MATIVDRESEGAVPISVNTLINPSLPNQCPTFSQLIVRDKWFYFVHLLLLAYIGAVYWRKGRLNEAALIVCSVNIILRPAITVFAVWLHRQKKLVAFFGRQEKIGKLLRLRFSPLLVLGLITALIVVMWLATNGWVGLT
jgi:hypothetical protein